MLNSLKWRALLCSVPLILLSGTLAPVLGNHPLSTTVYEAPAATVLALPTSYVVPTSYVLPSSYVSTSYVVPTSYVSTSYAVPTTYATTYLSPTYYLAPTSYVVPTYYQRRGLFGRRSVYATSSSYYVPTVYYPSVSYLPTAYAVPVVTTARSSAGCDEVTSGSVSTAPLSQRSTAGSGARGPGAAERAPSPPVESTPTEPPPPSQGTSSAVESQPKAEPTAPPPGPDPGTPPPPAAPAPEGNPNPNLPAPPPAPPGPPPAAPPAGAGPAVTREVQKPVLPEGAGRPALAPRSNVLAGKVVAGETGQPEENVRVTVSSRVGAFADRTGTTDAYGHYAIRLPDGDWTVKVAMPSGRAFDVSRITVSGGQITDDRGRDVPSLTITR